jgi:uncharacterized repeat protein (TIGR01451 family)
MRRNLLRAAVVLSALAAPAAVAAQYAAPAQASALPPPMYIRLAGPEGMKVTIYRGQVQPQTLATPCVVAFRPGYRYRLELSDIKGHRLATVYPSLDVLGSLRLPHGMRASDHPATIQFSDDDFATVRSGAVVAKMLLLERPETAIPIATRPEVPLEITLPPSRDPYVEAAERGRPLVVLHMGGREYTPQELAAQGVPGTVLLPGEKVLPPPRDPPCLPWMCYPFTDPRVGQSPPEDEVCFHDGGDQGLRAGINPDGKLVGVDPSDTVARYVDSQGNIKVAVSNKVCLCVPRYLLVRTAFSPAVNTMLTGPGDTRVVHGPMQAQREMVIREQRLETTLAGLTTRIKASSVINLQQLQITARVEGLVIYVNGVGTGHITGKCPEPVVEPIDLPLVIIKWPDKCDLQVGDIVTFFIRYKNQGQRPITGIVVADSLTARLEYVAGSARSDRDALFSTTPNEVDSSQLRWEISGSLPPGQSGTVSFQARVR